MNWKEPKQIEDNKYDLPGDWLKIEYFEALNILFRVENSLRIFVFIILKNEYKDKWKDLSVTSDDSESSTINAIAKKRIAQDKNYAYLGYVMTSPLLHLTSGELIRIITSDSYWKLFKDYFLGSREIIKNKLDEIGNVRNSLAHFRPVKKGDLELVKQNSIHTLSEVEKTLHDFISCPYIVPTNTEDSWYTELTTLGTEECIINFKQSKNEEWIKLILDFKPPILDEVKAYSGLRIRTITLKTDRVLINYPELTSELICVTEVLPHFFAKNPNFNELKKSLKFTFSKNCLTKNYKRIKSELEHILLQINRELALIKEDNLARGKLIEVITCNVTKSESEYYHLQNQPFKIEIDGDSPVEYWGQLNYSTNNFITETENYPWMPVTISDDNSLPF